LSITAWKSVSAELPPTSEAAWAGELVKFRQIPQACATHAGVSLAQFE